MNKKAAKIIALTMLSKCDATFMSNSSIFSNISYDDIQKVSKELDNLCLSLISRAEKLNSNKIVDIKKVLTEE